MRFWWAIGLVSLTLVACSKEKDEPSAGVSLVREIHADSLADATKLKNDAKLKCQDPAQCPANVGLFLATKPDGVLSCTAFLVEDDIVATNAHCVPYEVANVPELCSSRVSVIFAGSAGRSEESVACAEFLGASPRPNPLSPDLALFRLARKTGRAPFLISKEGVKPGAAYGALKVNPAPGASGILVHGACKAVSRSYRFMLFEKAADPIFTVGDCRSVPGNSGSPLLNGAGLAVGILQTDLTVTSEQMKKVWGAHLLPGEEFAPLALGTSLRCLLATNHFALRADCPVVDDQAVPRPRIDELLPPGGKEADAALSPLLATLPAGLHFEPMPVKTQALVREETLRPTCFRAPGPWLDDFAILSNPGEYLGEATLTADIPTLEAKILFNRYLQVSAQYSVKGREAKAFGFSPRDLVDTGSSSLEANGSSARLSFCAEE